MLDAVSGNPDDTLDRGFFGCGHQSKLARAGDFDSNYLHLREDEAALV
ncbi:MAG TPA: hypothetical protein VF702_03490 [Allosphingosinicella sp.]|jgi:hypothetical protein